MRVLGLEDVKIIKMSERQWSNNTSKQIMALDEFRLCMGLGL